MPLNLFNSNKTISIDFGANEIKVVEGKYTKKGVAVGKYFTIKLPNCIYDDGEIQDMDQMAYLLRNGLTENKIMQADVHGIVNSSKIIIREISMPKIAENEIENILKYQLEDYIPIHPDDYVVKFINLGTALEDNIEKINLLLIGVPRVMVESHLNLLRSISLKPQVLDYQGNAIGKLISMGDIINNHYSNSDTIVSMDMGYDSTSITIVNKGMIKVSRIVEVGVNNIIDNLEIRLDLSKDEVIEKIMNIKDINERLSTISDAFMVLEGTREVLQDLMEKTEMIFRYYTTRNLGNEINLVLLHGGLSNMNGMEKLFSDYFSVPCIKFNSLNKIKFNGDLSKYAVSIGGLIRLDGVKA